MTQILEKESLLKEFTAYLEQLDDNPLEETAKTKNTDLYSLLIEMSELKNEIKIQARQYKTALDNFQEVITWLQENQAKLERDLNKKAQQFEQDKEALSKTFLLELVAFRDRLILAMTHIKNSLQTKENQSTDDIHFKRSVLEGQKITLNKINQQLKNHQVRLINTRNKRLNPHFMKAVAIEENFSDYQNGQIIEEISAGYTWHSQVLRLAEVKVNKKQETKEM